MSLYNLQVEETAPGTYDITIRCLYARVRAVVEVAEAMTGRPDAREQAVSLIAEKHDAACSHRCVDSLKRGSHPTRVVTPSVTLEIGEAALTITDKIADILDGGRPEFVVEIKCQHGMTGLEAKVDGPLPLPDPALLRAYWQAAQEAGRRHRASSRCDCVPDPDADGE